MSESQTEDGDTGGESDATPQSDVETLQLAIEEGRASIQQQVQFINEFYKDAIRAFQIYLTLVGLLVTAYKLTGGGNFWASIELLPVGVGVGTFILAAIVGLAVYHSTQPLIGIGSDGIKEAREGGYTHHEYLAVLAQSYEGWLDINADWNRYLSVLNLALQILLICSFISLAIGLLA